MRAVLISTYELGRQPFGLASPAAWLRRDGHEVTCVDLSRTKLPVPVIRDAGLIAFFLPMHTATRLFPAVATKVREVNPTAHLAAYGLYAPLNRELLESHGVHTVLGGEFEEPLAALARNLAANQPAPDFPPVSLARQQFIAPDRAGLPPLAAYSQLTVDGHLRRVGYTEASRGCKHLCRHCPIVPVYNGAFRIVQRDAVLEDIRRQVAAGAEHITFGDPDFFNGPGHAIPLIEALHREWPSLTYDVTIKVEHLLQHRALLGALRRTGCLFVTTAVESLDDAVLGKLAKGHTRADFFEALRLTRAAEIPLSPTFIPFHPWTTLASYRDFLQTLASLDITPNVSSIQLAIRLLIPKGSLLLELPEIRDLIDPFDPIALCYPWRHPSPDVDALAKAVHSAIHKAGLRHATRPEIFHEIYALADAGSYSETPRSSRATIPFLTEPWYC